MNKNTTIFDTPPTENERLTLTAVNIDHLQNDPTFLQVGQNPRINVTDIQLCAYSVQIFNEGKFLASTRVANEEVERLEEWLSENANPDDYMVFEDALEQIEYQKSEME